MTVGIIPARWGSKRFPGKPLANIAGKSLIQRTYENAARSTSLDALVVATDDERIVQHVKSFGGNVVMTSPDAPSGTDRMGEAIKKYFPHASIAVNIQGDEPCISPQTIDILIETLKQQPEKTLTTPITRIIDHRELFDPSVVKCVFNNKLEALYFSRLPIPYVQNPQKNMGIHYRHVGIYCFACPFLHTFLSLPMTPLQTCEDLEQLKILEQRYRIQLCIVDEKARGVDTPEDIQKIEEFLCQENTSLLQEALSPL